VRRGCSIRSAAIFQAEPLFRDKRMDSPAADGIGTL